MRNVVDDPNYAEVAADLREQLARIQERYGDSLASARELVAADLAEAPGQAH